MPPKRSPRKHVPATKKTSQPTRKKAAGRKVPISRETISDSSSEDGNISGDSFIVDDDADEEEMNYDEYAVFGILLLSMHLISLF